MTRCQSPVSNLSFARLLLLLLMPSISPMTFANDIDNDEIVDTQISDTFLEFAVVKINGVLSFFLFQYLFMYVMMKDETVSETLSNIFFLIPISDRVKSIHVSVTFSSGSKDLVVRKRNLTIAYVLHLSHFDYLTSIVTISLIFEG